MTREEFINWFQGFTLLTPNDIYDLGQLYDEVTKPQWISIKEELPPKDGRYLFYDEFLGPRVSAYYVECTLVKEITHWMPLPQAPVVSNPSDTGKKSNFDENCEKYRTVFDGWEDLTFEERRDRINKFRSGQW